MTTQGSQNEGAPASRNAIGRFLLIALPTMLIFYGFIYYPHRSDGVFAQGLTGYLHLIAALAGGVLGLFDRAVAVNGHQIGGRFPLSIILDCSALDAQALYVAAVFAIRAPWREKIAGVVGGLVLLTTVNLARIVTLYFVGVRAPHLFHVLHEEVFQVTIILSALGAFGLWVYWTRGRAHPRHAMPRPA